MEKLNAEKEAGHNTHATGDKNELYLFASYWLIGVCIFV
jgi:hypothetical protein